EGGEHLAFELVRVEVVVAGLVGIADVVEREGEEPVELAVVEDGRGGIAERVGRLGLERLEQRVEPPPIARGEAGHPTCTLGRRSGSGSALRRTSRQTGAVSPSPKARNLSR